MAKRTSRGRQRIEMKKIQNEQQLQATFSKRRLGLIKTANEMCTLTGAQIALFVFSPSNKVYPFGNPEVKTVIDRYEDHSRQPLASHHMMFQSRPQANQEKLNSELSLLENKMEALKKRGKLLDQLIEKDKSENWLEAFIQELDLNKLEELLKAMKEIHKDVTKDMHTMLTYFLQENNFPNNDDGTAVLNRQIPFDFVATATNDFIHNAADPSGTHGVSSPTMGRCSFNQMAPATKDFYKNAAVPSIIDGISSMNVGEKRSNRLAHLDSRESGIASVVHCVGSSRTNGASEMNLGESSSSRIVSFNSIAP